MLITGHENASGRVASTCACLVAVDSSTSSHWVPCTSPSLCACLPKCTRPVTPWTTSACATCDDHNTTYI